MRIRRFLAITVAGVGAAIGISTGVAFAASTSQLVQGVNNRSLYKAADTVTVNGVVNGDIFCAGQTVTINATVNGDILCTGQNINVNGTVNGSVRLVGQNVTLAAKVTQSASLVGQNVTVEDGAAVGRDLSFTAQSFTSDGAVGRDVNGAGNSVTLANPVGRNVAAYANTLALNNGTAIVGNLTYTSPQKLQRSGDAYVHGVVTYHYGHTHHAGGVSHQFVWFQLYWIIAMIALGLVLVALFPRLFHAWNPEWGPDFWWSMLTGFVAMFAVPAVILVLVFTLVGVPLAILLALLWVAALFVAMPLAAYFTGSLIIPRRHPVLMVLVGSLVLGLLWLIPIIGWIVSLVAFWVGVGTLLRGLRRNYRAPTYRAEA